IDPKKEPDKHAAAQSQFDAKWGASVVVGVDTDPVKSAQMLAFINWECDRGNPIMTGVTYTNRDGNKDEITDHWIVITGRVGPAGANQFSYNNPAEFGDAVSASSNVLAWTDGKLQATTKQKNKPAYIVSWIRPDPISLKIWNDLNAKKAPA